MDNGHEELKKVADWVCGRHDEDGLVEVVAHILEVRRG
jgi:hydroxymethylpyrimidine pyrophosphatase-like HAD family hydrolase